MDFSIRTLIDLLNSKSINAEAYEIQCGDSINTSVTSTDSGIKVSFDSPFIYIVIKKVGKVNIFDIKRKINSITICEKSVSAVDYANKKETGIFGTAAHLGMRVTIDIDDFPDITKEF